MTDRRYADWKDAGLTVRTWRRATTAPTVTGAVAEGLWTEQDAALQHLRRFTQKRLLKSPSRALRDWLKQPVDPEVAAELAAIMAIPVGKDRLDAFRTWKEHTLCAYDARREAAEDRRAAEWVQAGKQTIAPWPDSLPGRRPLL